MRPGAARAARRGGAAAADRLRQRGGPAARSRRGRQREIALRTALGAGRRPARAPAAHREPAARGRPADCCGLLAGARGASGRWCSPRRRRSRGSTRSGSTAGCSASRSASPCSPASCSGWRPRCTRARGRPDGRARPTAGRGGTVRARAAAGPARAGGGAGRPGARARHRARDSWCRASFASGRWIRASGPSACSRRGSSSRRCATPRTTPCGAFYREPARAAAGDARASARRRRRARCR